jgi:hypothetical protein
MMLPKFALLEMAPPSVAALGVAVTVLQQGTAQVSGSDFVINGGVLITLVISIVGSLAAAVTFLYKSQSAANAAAITKLELAQSNHIKDLDAGHVRELAAKEQTIAVQEASIIRLNARTEAILLELAAKDKYMLDLATGVIATANEQMEKVANFTAENADAIRQLHTAISHMNEADERHHQNNIAVLTMIAHKLGTQVLIGDRSAIVDGERTDFGIKPKEDQ